MNRSLEPETPLHADLRKLVDRGSCVPDCVFQPIVDADSG